MLVKLGWDECCVFREWLLLVFLTTDLLGCGFCVLDVGLCVRRFQSLIMVLDGGLERRAWVKG